MSLMFYDAQRFNQPLDKWDTTNVTNMSGMFERATSFNQPLNDWDTSNVKAIGYMFSKAKKFNQSLDNWNISKVVIDYDIKDIFLDSGLEEDNYCKLFKGKSKDIWTKYKSVLGVSSYYKCN